MRILRVLPFIALAFLCWGNYGPLMHEGQHGMAGSSLRPFVCVGMAYFLIAVIVPVLVLGTRGEQGHWTLRGTLWSLLAGTVGALGALGIVMAFKYYGRPIYVMPLVFGLAPVVNTFVTMLMSRTLGEARGIFFVGVAIVALGAAGVMYFKPAKPPATTTEISEREGSIIIKVPNKTPWVAKSLNDLETNPELKPALAVYRRQRGPSQSDFIMVCLSIALAALSWGSYGPVLHQGQMKMAGSRLRPFLCVGLAYFGIAVIVPLIILQTRGEVGAWTPEGSISGILWSLGAGAAGAIGALGIIMSFTFGGKPIFVMPLVFGCAPVVNSFTSMLTEGTMNSIQPPFIVSLVMVVLGAVMVLIFAPRPSHPPGGGHGPSGKDHTKPVNNADEAARQALLGKE